MTDDRDRGAYTPSGDAPLAFDARQSGGKGAGRPPTTLIISALILLVLVVALIFYYRSGVRRAGEPPVVGAPVGSMKEAAPASVQSSDAAAGLQIYRAEQGASASSGTPTFAPLVRQHLRLGQEQPEKFGQNATGLAARPIDAEVAVHPGVKERAQRRQLLAHLR